MDFLRRKIKERLAVFNGPWIFLVDFHTEASEVLHANSAAFLSNAKYNVTCQNAFDEGVFSANLGGPVMVLLNPPYGHRLANSSDTVKLYKKIGAAVTRWMHDAAPGSCGFCICPDEDTWKAFSQAIQAMDMTTRHFTHGGEDVRIVRWVVS